MQSGRLPFTDSYIARLPYVENSFITADGTTGLTSCGYTYRSGNMFDPRAELGGAQPMQYDLLSLVYLRYRVISCEVTVTFSNPSLDGMWVGVRVRPDSNPVATTGQPLDYVQEMDNTMIAPLNNTGSQTKAFKFNFRNRDILGMTEAQHSDVVYTGLFASGAGAGALIEPFASHTVSGENATVRYNVRIVYTAYCSERKTYPQS